MPFSRYFMFSLLGSVAGLAGCLQPAGVLPPGKLGTDAAPAAAVTRVTVMRPARKTLIRRVAQPGEIQALEQTPLHAKVTGYIQTVHVDIGDRVEAGDLLAEISIPEYEHELKQKVALVAQAKAETAQAQAAIKVAQAAHRSSEALANEAEAAVERVAAEHARANSEFERVSQLFDNKAVTQKIVDEARSVQRAAAAAQAEAKARIHSAQAIVAEKSAAVEQSEADAEAIAAKEEVASADLERLKAIHAYTRITAPYPGVITERHIDTGHFIQPGKSNGDKPLLVVARVDRVRVFVDVPEADAVLVTTGCEATIRIPSSGMTIPGQVSRTAWKLDPTSRTLRTAIDLENPDDKLRAGQYVIADLKVGERQTRSPCPSRQFYGRISKQLVWPSERTTPSSECRWSWAYARETKWKSSAG
jgi:multidrug resistance efflux pump